MFNNFKKYIPWVVALVIAVSALWAWYHPQMAPGTPVWLDGTVTLTRTKYLPAKLETPDCTVQTVDANKDKEPDMLNGNPVTAIGETPKSKIGFDIRTTITPLRERRGFMQPKTLLLASK
jgi:hypothetical protein